MTSQQQQVFVIRILVYNESKHQFSPDIDIIQQRSLRHGGRMVHVSLDSARMRGIFLPSTVWMQDYREWNNFSGSNSLYNHHHHHRHNNCPPPMECIKGQPIFSSTQAVHDFNDKGAALVTRLRQELLASSKRKNHNAVVVKIEDYLPLFSNIKVGDAVSAWWHIKDQNYNYVVPIQHLPVSDNLKSRIMAWRFRKGKNWLDDTCCRSLNEEGHDIEEHILWELNVRETNDDNNKNNNNNKNNENCNDLNIIPRPKSNLALSRQSSIESVHYFTPVHQAGVVIE